MANTLTSQPVSVVLQRLLDAEYAHDDEQMTTLAAAGTSPWDLDAVARAELFKDVYMSVSGVGGRLLYLLARATGARTVIEYGTSFGVSTIHLAAAVRDNGGGTVITTELQGGKAQAAQHNFADAGLADLIEVRTGDARQTLADLTEPVDLVLLDGWPDLAKAVLHVVEPRLRPGSVVLIDDVQVDWGRDLHGELIAYLEDPANGYTTLTLPLADGIQLAVRV